MKEKKVPNKQKRNSTLFQSKENSIDIEKKVQVGAELLASLTSSILHTSITSSSRLNFPTINVDNKDTKVGGELLSIAPHVDTLSLSKHFLVKLIQGYIVANMSNDCYM